MNRALEDSRGPRPSLRRASRPRSRRERFRAYGVDERRSAERLGQQFLERLPIVLLPSGSQNFSLALRKTRMVKYDLGSGALLHQLELRNRIDAWMPAASSPGLHDSFVRHKFHLPSRDV